MSDLQVETAPIAEAKATRPNNAAASAGATASASASSASVAAPAAEDAEFDALIAQAMSRATLSSASSSSSSQGLVDEQAYGSAAGDQVYSATALRRGHHLLRCEASMFDADLEMSVRARHNQEFAIFSNSCFPPPPRIDRTEFRIFSSSCT